MPATPGPHHTPTRPSLAPHSNPALDPQGDPQTLGQDCWRCRQPRHFHWECLLMEVGQVIWVTGPSTPSPGLRFALDQVIKIDSQLVRPDAMQAYPHFASIRDKLWSVSLRQERILANCWYQKSTGKLFSRGLNPMALHMGGQQNTCPDNGPTLLALHLGRSCPMVNQLAITRVPLHS